MNQIAFGPAVTPALLPNLQTLLPFPFGLGELERLVKRPRVLLCLRPLSLGFGVSCLEVQLSLLHPPLFHATQYPLGMKPIVHRLCDAHSYDC